MQTLAVERRFSFLVVAGMFGSWTAAAGFSSTPNAPRMPRTVRSHTVARQLERTVHVHNAHEASRSRALRLAGLLDVGRVGIFFLFNCRHFANAAPNF